MKPILLNPATVTITIASVIDKYYIAGSGSDNNNGSANSPFATIQAGINALEDNDTIFVAAAYTENINFNGKTIYLKGANAGNNDSWMVGRMEVLYKLSVLKDQEQP